MTKRSPRVTTPGARQGLGGWGWKLLFSPFTILIVVVLIITFADWWRVFGPGAR